MSEAVRLSTHPGVFGPNSTPVQTQLLVLPDKGSVALRKLHCFTGGKIDTDTVFNWAMSTLHFGPQQKRNYILALSAQVLLAGTFVPPFAVARLSPRAFTTLANTTNGVGYLVQGALASPWCLFRSVAILTLVANAASATALKAISETCGPRHLKLRGSTAELNFDSLHEEIHGF